MTVAETFNHCHVPEERAELFQSEDGGSTEKEYLHLLHALVYCLKPLRVLETGTYRGEGSAFIAKALVRNGVGHLTTLECNPKMASWGRELLRVNNLSAWVDVLTTDSLAFLNNTDILFDFAFFDSAIPLRCRELSLCLDRGLLRPGSMCALHDTSQLRTVISGDQDPETAAHWEAFQKISGIKFIQFPLSRGMTLAQVL